MSQFDQTPKQRASIRQKYRDLIRESEGSENAAEVLLKANNLFKEVKSAEAATLDSAVLKKAASVNLQQAKDIKLSASHFHLNDFINKLQARLTTNDELDWTKLGSVVKKTCLRAPSIDFLLGPLAIQPKEKIKRVAQRIQKNTDLVVKPIQLETTDIQEQDNGTSSNVYKIYSILEKHGSKINFYKFIINPESFSQTVENLFYVSFLMRDEKVQVTIQGEEPMICAVDEEMYDSLGKQKSKQLVLDMDMKLWKDCIEKLKIKTSFIPTRIIVTDPLDQNKWYG